MLLITPGSAVRYGSIKPDCSAGDVESAVSYPCRTVSLADGAKVTMDSQKIRVEVSNPRLENKKMWIYESLGSPVASIVASVVTEVIDKPVTIVNERSSRGKLIVELKLAGQSL